MLVRLEAEPNARMTLEELQRFHELYERAAASLAKLTTFSFEPETRQYLESLIARAYGEIHETREKRRRIFPLRWFSRPCRKRFAVTSVLFIFLWPSPWRVRVRRVCDGFRSGLAQVTMPFGHDQLRPSERVKQEETAAGDRLTGRKSTFSAFLMTHTSRCRFLLSRSA